MTNTNNDLEALRTFALDHNEVKFAHLVTAALNGEAWAGERIGKAIRCGTSYPLLLADIIRSTDTARPDGATARKLINV